LQQGVPDNALHQDGEAVELRLDDVLVGRLHQAVVPKLRAALQNV